MRSLFAIAVSGVVLFAPTTFALAGCLKDVGLPGSIAKKSTAERSFTLSRPGALIEVISVTGKDKLSMSVKRPSGAAACKLRGPADYLSCSPTITKKSGEGVHVVRIVNKSARRVEYTLRCTSPD